MNRVAIFVDAGYLFAEGSVLLFGTLHKREFLHLDRPEVVAALKEAAGSICGQPLLRIYWYDAVRHGQLMPQHEDLAAADDVKLRLGQINSQNQQKGVDVLLVTDLAELARNRAITDAILLSGDEDVRLGVVLAQQFGVRVHLIGIRSGRSSQSPSLRREADTVVEWDAAIVGRFLSQASAPLGIAAPATDEPDDLDLAISGLIQDLLPAEVAGLKASFASSSNIPADYDRAVLRIGRNHHDRSNLTDAERASLRARFVRLIQDWSPADLEGAADEDDLADVL